MQKLSTHDDKNLNFETVLVLQGGGSLGAYECGVYKTLDKHRIKFDVVAGTSMGGINAAIIAGSKSDEPVKNLEDFWLNLAESATPSFLPQDKRAQLSSMFVSMWGTPNAFQPIWFMPNLFSFLYCNSPYLYDVEPLKKTIKEYVDFEKLKNPDRPRVIITSTDIQNGKSSIFDSKYDKIDATHVVAGCGYPFYGIAWTEMSGRYLWDGSLLSNTPLAEVINASPICDKKVYVVDLFPHVQKSMPKNMMESWHRARDIMDSDKTEHSVRMSKIISRYLSLIKNMHDFIVSSNLDEKAKKEFEKMESEYNKLACQRGAIIREIIRIKRQEEGDSHFLFENADFSLATIKQLISDGEKDAEKVLSAKP
jgi:NTE family protein